MIKVYQVKLPVTASVKMLRLQCAKLLGVKPAEIATLEVLRRSIDARKRPEIFFSYTLLVELEGGLRAEEKLVKRLRNRDVQMGERVEYRAPELGEKIGDVPRRDYFREEAHRPVVVGFGPAGLFAAKLIDECGLRGLRVGDAQVSEKHAGFIINLGSATAHDILSLMDEVRARVLAQTGVTLEPEVRILGEDRRG